jgi:CelD/BcsL family acetyltransferase involved in cellulose biosynthesis
VDIEILRPQSLPPALAQAWRAMQGRRADWDSPFLSPDWPAAVERAQRGADRGVRIAVLREAGGPKGFLAVRVGAFTAMAAGAPLCDYQGLVAEAGVRLDPPALVRALGVGRFDFTHMLQSESAFSPYAQGSAASWIVDLGDGYEAYAASRREAGVAALKDLDKKRRKAEREAGQLVFTPASQARADFDRLFAWKREQYRATGQVDVFAAGWPLVLMSDLFEAPAGDFGGRLFTLHMGGELAAAQFHLMGAGAIHAWMIAHDARFERYSPGLLLFQDILKWMDAGPWRRLDLGQGDYRFKRELANTRQALTHGFVGTPSPAAFLRGAAYGVRKAAEALPLGAVSALPGKAMRRLDLMRGLR